MSDKVVKVEDFDVWTRKTKKGKQKVVVDAWGYKEDGLTDDKVTMMEMSPFEAMSLAVLLIQEVSNVL